MNYITFEISFHQIEDTCNQDGEYYDTFDAYCDFTPICDEVLMKLLKEKMIYFTAKYKDNEKKIIINVRCESIALDIYNIHDIVIEKLIEQYNKTIPEYGHSFVEMDYISKFKI